MRKKVLVVDDDPTSNCMVNALLKSGGYDVADAKDGAEGIEVTKQENPDLIILDVSMPNMDGYTFLEELKSIDGYQLPPVIMLTAKEGMKDLFKMEGVADYFVKPLDSDALLGKVKECLGE